MLLSIIITVYNKEKYLERCLNSCINQRGGILGVDYEIVIINDGSTDGSQKIIDTYSDRYSSFKVIVQENQGLSIARNNGMKYAKGKYIWFVDADDSISLESVYILKNSINEEPDVLPMYAIYDGETFIHNEIPSDLITGEDVLASFKWEECAPFFFLRKGFLEEHKISFIPGIYHEDSEFTPRMLCFAKNIKVIPVVLYVIFSVPNSITQVPHVKRAYDLVTVSESLERLIPEVGGYYSKKGKSLAFYIAVLINSAMVIINKNDKKEQKKYSRFLYYHKNLFSTMSKAPQLKYKVEAYLYLFFSRKSVKVYNFLNIFMRH